VSGHFPYAERRTKLRALLKKAKLPAMLVSHEPNVRYLTGFTGEASQLLITPHSELMISDSRFETQLQNECPEIEAVIRTAKSTMADFLAQTLTARKVSRTAIEGDVLSVAEYEKYQEKAPATELVITSGIVDQLRMIKDKTEIVALRRAIDIAQRGFQAVQGLFTPEMTELEIAHELEHLMRRHGALKAAFEPIVGVGPQAALPHYRAGSARLADAPFVLIDWGAVEPSGYHSDLTRVLATSKIPPKLEKLYRVVFEAQAAAIALMRPGALAKDVDAAARKVISDNGFERYFGHGLGHGVGLEIHEQPRLSPLSDDVLQAGMVITVEPGIYLPGFGGVRLEDDVLITREGHEVLTSTPLEMGPARLA